MRAFNRAALRQPEAFRTYLDGEPFQRKAVKRALFSSRFSYQDLSYLYHQLKHYPGLDRLLHYVTVRMVLLSPQIDEPLFNYVILQQKLTGRWAHTARLKSFGGLNGLRGRIINAASHLVDGDVELAWRALSELPTDAAVYHEDWLIAQRLIEPEFTVFDIGASDGLTALLFRVFSEHVYAFDPNPAYAPLADPLAAVGVTFLNVGLSDHSGSAALHDDAENPGRSSYHPAATLKGGTTVSSQIRTLDELPLPPADYWKVDIEGSEADMLRGAATTLSRTPPRFVQIELWSSQFAEPFDLLSRHYDNCYTCRTDGGPIMFTRKRDAVADPLYRTIGTPIYVFSNEKLD